MKDFLVIGSRGSKLALWQTEWVRAQLLALYSRLEVRVEVIKTSGDVLKDAPLSAIGGRGVFTKEIEDALLEGRVDLAVHSLKDLPTTQPAGLLIAAVPQREDARDALVLPASRGRAEDASLLSLPEGAVVGTSSLRRLAQLKHLRPDLGIKDLRGNVDTRLRKLDAGGYDAIILAAAGLRRLGLEERISAPLPAHEMLPAVGQGALAVETRVDDAAVIELLKPLDHELTRAACAAERALLRSLGGGCQLPIAAHAFRRGNSLRVEGLVAGLSGDTIVRDQIEGEMAEAQHLGETLARQLRARGAESLLEGLPL